MPRLNADIVSVRIPNKNWLTDEEKRIFDEVGSVIAQEFTSESREYRTFDWLIAELCHNREQISNYSWQLNPDQTGR